LSILKFIIDMIIAGLFLSLATFYMRLKLSQQSHEEGAKFTRKNYLVFALIAYTFTMEFYYSVTYLLHRIIKQIYYPDDIKLEPYHSFRIVNTHIIDKSRNFTTALALLYMFDQLMRYQQPPTGGSIKLVKGFGGGGTDDNKSKIDQARSFKELMKEIGDSPQENRS
jgi:hypothetical protein